MAKFRREHRGTEVSSSCCGVILSAAVLQAERRISRWEAVCHGRSLGPLVKARALGMTPLRRGIQTELPPRCTLPYVQWRVRVIFNFPPGIA